MEIQTFSIVVGNRACDAHCPFCVSKMTGYGNLPPQEGFDGARLTKAIMLAQLGSTTTCLLTGKGEPTLYPLVLTEYLHRVGDKFPIIEMQTNGLQIGALAAGKKSLLAVPHLEQWKRLGLDTIAISVVSTRPEINAQVYTDDYPDLVTTIRYLHSFKFDVRLSVMMMWGGVDSVVELQHTIAFCKEHGVEQLTIRPIRKTTSPTHSEAASAFVEEHGFAVTEDQRLTTIKNWIDERGTALLPLKHGAMVYDLDGQNLCVADCLTVSKKAGEMRTVTYYGDGRIDFDWQHPGAVLLGGH